MNNLEFFILFNLNFYKILIYINFMSYINKKAEIYL